MNEQIAELETELRELEKKISLTAETFRGEQRTAGEAKANFEIAQARALLAIYEIEAATGDKLTEAVRKAKALKQCDESYLAYRIAESEADASKEVLRATLAQLSSVQSRCGLLKAEASLVTGNYK